MTEINTNDRDLELFVQAIELLNNNFYIDGIVKFNELISLDPNGDLADDAQFNIGLCYVKMNVPKKAIENFWKVINNYPDSTIAFSDQNKEFGRTPAKAYLGLLSCYLQLNDQNRVMECLEALKEYDDSYVITEKDGKEARVTYHQLAIQMVNLTK